MSEYIERDAVKDMLKRECSPRVMAYLVDELCEIHAADVRPVVRGRWEWDVLDGTPGYRPVVLCCSNCHRVSFSGWDYCPNCAADMREEK